MAVTAQDHRYMSRALQLARKGLYSTDPNPRVGCVVVRDGNIVGEGWHAHAGGPHAEVEALRMAGEHARGAHVYVSLEPCAHHGRTPPCTEALVQAGVSKVVAAMRDPNPLVSGAGLRQLTDAGIGVEHGVLEAEAAALNPGFIKRMRCGRPWVRVKLAMSLDGRTAMASGESRWITGPAARNDVHALRARSSAILTGIGTVLNDDPSLTVRRQPAPPHGWRQPLRVVLDPRLSTPAQARVLRQPGRSLIFTAVDDESTAQCLREAGAEVLCFPGGTDELDLGAVLDHLGTVEQLNEVMVETGATLSGALLRQYLIDELVLYVAPRFMGHGARGLFTLPGIDAMDQSLAADVLDVRAVGSDWRFTLRPYTRDRSG